MAGDTPTPIRNDKIGTRFHDGAEFDLQKAGKNLLSLSAAQERRKVDEVYASNQSAQAAEFQARNTEFNSRPRNVVELAKILAQLQAQRIRRMEPSETPFLRDEAA
ncbi:MAG: hypothetical protein V4678_02490 [Patescibacteria group bacterium]